MEKKAAIIIEIDEEIAPAGTPAELEAFCPACGRLVAMAAPRAAALACGVSERQIFRLIEEQRLHFIETDRVLVCLDSLKQFEGA